jgi:transketolase
MMPDVVAKSAKFQTCSPTTAFTESNTRCDSVLPPSVKARVAVEQASTLGWERYVGSEGAVSGMSTFGASAPLKELLTKFGFTPDAVVEQARAQIASQESSDHSV